MNYKESRMVKKRYQLIEEEIAKLRQQMIILGLTTSF